MLTFLAASAEPWQKHKHVGFRKSHSTAHAVNYSVNKILTELEKRNHVIGVFVDLSKAFDTLDHKKLLVKLEHYGIRGTCYELLKNYLIENNVLIFRILFQKL